MTFEQLKAAFTAEQIAIADIEHRATKAGAAIISLRGSITKVSERLALLNATPGADSMEIALAEQRFNKLFRRHQLAVKTFHALDLDYRGRTIMMGRHSAGMEAIKPTNK